MKRAKKRVLLKNIRGSYVFLQTPQKSDRPDEEPKYKMQVLQDKDNKEQVAVIKKAIKQVALEAFGKDVKLGSLKLPLRDGDEEKSEEEYQNHYFFNSNNSRKPEVVVNKKINGKWKPADEEDFQEKGYSGCYFNVAVEFYAFPADNGKAGIAVSLGNVMLVEAGDRLDGSKSASEDFEGISAEEIDDDDDFDLDDDDDFDLD